MNDNHELEQLWCSQSSGLEAKGEDMLAVAMKKSKRFDRLIAVRNASEILAGAVVAIIYAIMAVHASNALTRAGYALVAASGVWIAGFMLRYGRERPDPRPDQSLRGYQQALVGKYEHQVRLLKNVKYWYLLPPYAGLVIASVGEIQESGFRWFQLAVPALYTAVFACVWWLNEIHGVRFLEAQRSRVLEAMNRE